MGLSKLQSRGQVTIPADVRRAAGLVAGQIVAVESVGRGQVRLTALRGTSLDDVFKHYGGPGSVPRDLWVRVGDGVARDVLRASRGETRKPRAGSTRARRRRGRNP
jgi:bifunctional DNA-binding transcriptional regulator/antitoxin component of YhaV-PrlF toxin-antitoxin module